MKRLILIFGVMVLALGCARNAGSSTVELTITNEDGVPIQNCNVKLTFEGSAESQWGVDFYLAQTDIDGKVSFSNDKHTYFDVFVWKGTWTGCDFVEFKPGTDARKNTIIYPPGTVFNGCF